MNYLNKRNIIWITIFILLTAIPAHAESFSTSNTNEQMVSSIKSFFVTIDNLLEELLGDIDPDKTLVFAIRVIALFCFIMAIKEFWEAIKIAFGLNKKKERRSSNRNIDLNDLARNLKHKR